MLDSKRIFEVNQDSRRKRHSGVIYGLNRLWTTDCRPRDYPADFFFGLPPRAGAAASGARSIEVRRPAVNV